MILDVSRQRYLQLSRQLCRWWYRPKWDPCCTNQYRVAVLRKRLMLVQRSSAIRAWWLLIVSYVLTIAPLPHSPLFTPWKNFSSVNSLFCQIFGRGRELTNKLRTLSRIWCVHTSGWTRLYDQFHETIDMVLGHDFACIQNLYRNKKPTMIAGLLPRLIIWCYEVLVCLFYSNRGRIA